MDMTVLERHQARLKWVQQQQQKHNYVNQNNSLESCSMPQFQGFLDRVLVNGDMVDWKKKPEKHMGDGNGDFPRYVNLSIAGTESVSNGMYFEETGVAIGSLEIDHCLSGTSSCRIGAVEAEKMEEQEVVVMGLEGENVGLMEKMQFDNKGEGSNKRKTECVAAGECKDKRVKRAVEVDSKIKEKISIDISSDSKENQKTSEVPKSDYIRVRARRGQATDSHSIAERARREKISKKMKCLQDLVPGCNKITGRAAMLDEIINYVQSLQRQVEFLSIKLAALNPRPDFNVDNFPGKQFPAYVASEPEARTNHPQNLSERTSNSSALIFSELCLDLSHFPQVQPFWDSDHSPNLQNVGFHQG